MKKVEHLIRHYQKMSLGQKASDKISSIVGSWKFIGIQTLIVVIWVALNIIAWVYRWDPYPFILLNLAMGIQSAYTAPIIMMSQNRTEERDRRKAELDFRINIKAEKEIEQIQAYLKKIEKEKIEKILEILENKK